LHVVVVGGGTMGSGIAQAYLQARTTVTVVEIDDGRAARSRTTIERGLQRWAAKSGDDALAQEALTAFTITTAPTAGLAPDLVVESVPEQIATKVAVLRQLSQIYPDAILATNTSALSIDLLAESLRDAGRFAGMHFFNPVPVSALVEIVRGAATRPDVLDICHRHVARLGKSSIEVRDAPGFATSRLGIAIGLEAMRMVEEDVATVEDIDQGMVLGYRFPIGPLELSDLVGLDVRLAIADHLYSELGERFRPPEILRALVERGRLGVKSGQGFYEWDQNGRKRIRSEQSSSSRRVC
jgi:3-hydroxybutyryl-CoA dehydrogenase